MRTEKTKFDDDLLNSGRRTLLKIALLLLLAALLCPARIAFADENRARFIENAKPMLERMPRMECYYSRSVFNATNYYYFTSDGTNYLGVSSITPFTIDTLGQATDVMAYGISNNIHWSVSQGAQSFSEWVTPTNISPFQPNKGRNENAFFSGLCLATETLRLGVLHALPFTFQFATNNSFAATNDAGGRLSGSIFEGKNTNEIEIDFVREPQNERGKVILTDTNGFLLPLPSKIAVYDGRNALHTLYKVTHSRRYDTNEVVRVDGPARFAFCYATKTSHSVLSNSAWYISAGGPLIPQEAQVTTPLMRVKYISLYLIRSPYFVTIAFGVTLIIFLRRGGNEGGQERKNKE